MLTGRNKVLRWTFPALLIVAIVGVAGWIHFRRQQADARLAAGEMLAGIAAMKVGQIESWLKERRGNAELARSSMAVQQFLRDSDDATRTVSLSVIEVFRQAFDYEVVAIFDAQGTVRAVVPADGLEHCACAPAEVAKVLSARTTRFSDLHRCGPGKVIHLCLLAPIEVRPPTDQPGVGVLLLGINPQHFLYPLVQNWPTRRGTEETALVRSEGTQILYLSNPRHARDAALNLRMPLAGNGLLPVRTPAEDPGLTIGPDFRGVPVLRVVRPVPGTPWSLLAQLDQEEINAPVRREAWMTSTAAALLVLSTLLAGGLLWRQQKLTMTRRELAERMRTEAARRESEERFTAFMTNLPGAAFIKDANGQTLFVNPYLENLLGFGSWQGKTTPELVGGDLGLKMAEDDRKALAGGPVRTEETMADSNGTLRTFQTVKFPICSADKPLLLGGISLDITERRRTEAENQRLAMAVEQAAESIIITDSRGTIQYVNPAFEKCTGYDRQEVLGQNPRILKSGQQDATFYRRLWETLTAGQVWQGHFSNKRKNGDLYEEEATISPIRDKNGAITNYVAIKLDVTRERQLERQMDQAQKMESVGRLAGGVAHDFNNLLQAILGHTELLLEQTPASDTRRADLQEILSTGQRAADLTRQLLAFARKQAAVPRAYDLNDAIGHMLRMLRRLIGENIALEWAPCADLWPVFMDPSQVDQILANLVVNARDAIAGVGQIRISVRNAVTDAGFCSSRAEAIPGEYVVLTVSDTGCGIAKEDLSRIFEPFFTTKGLAQGTGLGLSMVYGIVKQNRGFIDVDSEPGRGATFSIYLPRHTTAEPTSEPEAVPDAGVPRGDGETILFVEDEPSVLALGTRMLQKLGYEVLGTASPTEAVRIATRHSGSIALLVSDVVLPEMNGRVLSDRIRALRPKVRLLFISGYTADVMGLHGIQDGTAEFLQKPFSLEALATKVHHALSAGEPPERPG